MTIILIEKKQGMDRIRIEINLEELQRNGIYQCCDSQGWYVKATIKQPQEPWQPKSRDKYTHWVDRII